MKEPVNLDKIQEDSGSLSQKSFNHVNFIKASKFPGMNLLERELGWKDVLDSLFFPICSRNPTLRKMAYDKKNEERRVKFNCHKLKCTGQIHHKHERSSELSSDISQHDVSDPQHQANMLNVRKGL